MKMNFLHLFLTVFVLASCNVISTLSGKKTKINGNKNGQAQPVHNNACEVAGGCDHSFDASTDEFMFSDASCTTAWITSGTTPETYARCWQDLSGGANISRAAGFTGIYRPTIQNGNGAYLIRGSGGDQGTEASFADINPMATQTWFIVFKMHDLPGTGLVRFLFGNDTGLTGTPGNITGVSISDTGVLNAYFGGPSPISTSAATINTSKAYLLEIVSNGSQFELYIDRTLIGQQSSPYSFNLADDMAFGGLNATNGYVSGGNTYFFEVLIFNRYLSDSDRTNVENYLQGKWNY